MSWVSKSVFSADGDRSSVEVWFSTLDTVCEQKKITCRTFFLFPSNPRVT